MICIHAFRRLRGELTIIEKQVFDLETSYLEEARDFGSVFSGRIF